MTAEGCAVSLSPRAEVLAALARLPYPPVRDTSELARALHRLADSGELLSAGPGWWNAFDEHARRADRRLPATAATPVAKPAVWRRLLPTRENAPEQERLPPFWDWALAVCAADGRTRQAALDPSVLPFGERGLTPLLVVRCADWVAPVRTAAQAALAEVLTRSDDAELAWAAAVAWTCEERQRGAEAVRLVVDRLADAPPSVWDRLVGDPSFRVRRRALAQALEMGRCDSAQLLALAVSDADVLVAQRAAEHLLRTVVPPGIDAQADPQAEAVVRELLASRIPGVRAASVTVLRRAQRPDLAEPFTTDRSASVREVARWVLRSCGQDPAEVCRRRLAHSPAEISPGVVSGLAECGDDSDAPLLRPYVTHQRPKVRAAALRALGAMRPPAITPEELQAVLDRDPSPSVVRTAATLLKPDAGAVPRQRLESWLAPGRPAPLRRHAARLLRASGTWNRLEVDLRLLGDEDEGLAREARRDTHVWAASATASYERPADGQRELLASLLEDAVDVIDPRSADRIRFALAHARRTPT